MRKVAWLLSAVAISPLAPSVSAQVVAERYVMIANEKDIGYLRADRSGNNVTIDFYVNDNGRGPKTKERLSLGPDGLPMRWSITGESYAGGRVNENFTYSGSNARWTGLSESGSKRTGDRRMFVAAAGSPWALGLYARYLQRQPEMRASVLPFGTMRLTKLGSRSLGTGAAATSVDIYELDGLELVPQFLLLDKSGALVANLNGRQLLVREAEKAASKQLVALNTELTDRVLGDMHQRLAHHVSVPWRVTNVHIFDPRTQTLTPISTVVVYDDRIVRVEPGRISAAPSGERMIDGQGGTLMPGIVDMHAHERGWLGYQRLAAGVTTIRDMGNDNEFLLDMDAKRRRGEADGPRIVRAGYLEGKSPYSATEGILVDNLADGLKGVHWYADHGYAFFKSYNSLKPEWMPPLVNEAHHLGMRVLGHIPAFTTADAMIEAGYDEVTHLNQLMLQYVLQPGEDTRTPLRLTAMHRFAHLDLNSAPVRHTIEMMQARHVALDTTIAAMERLNIQRDRVTPPGDRLYLDHMPVMFQRNRRRTFLNIPDAQTDREHFQARDKLVEMVRLLHSKGITQWPGTDDEVAYTIHRELELYVEAGIPAAETLRIDTWDTIKYLGLDHDLGTVEAGKLADFILVPRDPTKDITTLRDVSLVVKGGTIYYPTEIYTALGIEPFTGIPRLQ